jgi:hypothetical protein
LCQGTGNGEVGMSISLLYHAVGNRGYGHRRADYRVHGVGLSIRSPRCARHNHKAYREIRESATRVDSAGTARDIK